MSRVETGGLLVAPILHDFIEKEALPDTGVESAASWGGYAGLTRDLAPANKRLLARRDELQAEIDAGHRQVSRQEGGRFGLSRVPSRLRLSAARGGRFSISTANVNPEIATVAGPQLVVPVTNAR